MTQNEYRSRKLMIFEKAEQGEITDDQKKKLLVMLENKNEEDKLSESEINDFFDKLTSNYPDLEDDIKKLQKKVDKQDGDDDSDDDDEDSAVEEAVRDLISLVDIL